MYNFFIYFKNEKGITLIEMILSIAIVSILLLIAVPKKEVILNFKERKELLELKNDIIFARNKSIIDMVTYSIKIYPKADCYSIYKYEKNPEMIDKKYFKSGIEIEKVNFNDSLTDYHGEIMFKYTGSPRKGGTIFIKNRKNEKIRMTVEPATGKVNLYLNEE